MLPRIASIVLLCGVLTARALAQGSSAPPELAGVVKDQTGAVLRAVTVRVFDDGGEEPLHETTTDALGRFAIELPAGEYRLEVFAPAFQLFDEEVTLGPETEPLEIVLDLEPVEVELDVTPGEQLIADTTMSLTSETLSGNELLDLPRNEEEMARYLMLLAGADITGNLEDDILANFVIDGFSDNRLPSPDQIAQIIVDPNSLSADGEGQARIEIVTRPASGDWRRSLDLGFGDESLNATVPGESQKEPRQSWDLEGQVEGPVIPNQLEMSFEFSTQMDDQAGDQLHAITPSGNVFQGVVLPVDQREFEIRTELQLNPSHRLDTEFSYGSSEATNAGVGGFTLPERGSDERGTEWGFQIIERMLGEDMTNSLRFEFGRETSRLVPLSEGYAVDVADAFEGGGGTDRSDDDAFTIGLDNSLRWERGPWSIEWSTELSYDRERNIDEENFNGTYEFASLHDYCLATEFVGVNCTETQQIVETAIAQGVPPVYLDASGRENPITGLPVTFKQAYGNADLTFSELAFETFVQGDREFGERASLRLGLQYQGTNHSLDYLRFEPTANFQYQLTEDTLVSAGLQLNFEDFTDYETLLRNDGSTYQSELAISQPPFPDPFDGGTVEIGEETRSRWELGPDYKSPYFLEPQVSMTQEVAGTTRVTLSYRATFGYRERRIPNINAPFPGTPLPEEILELPVDERRELVSRMRPFYPYVGNITQIETTGRSVGHRVRVQVRPRGTFEMLGMGLSGNLTYTYGWAYDDDEYNNPYAPEWGPAARAHEVQSQFRLSMPAEISYASPVLSALAQATYEGMNFNFRFRGETGDLYSIDSGRDLNGDQATGDRPPGMARNTEVGPGAWHLDMTLTKDYRLGPVVGESGGHNRDRGREGGRGGEDGFDGRRIRFQVRVQNLFNHAQPRAYGNVLTSPLFGQPTGYIGGRSITLSLSVAF
ncbi:MAG: carboxypeptidase regulatory-like domain-containing protein [Gammaproteobacteria bacterium]